MADKRNANQVLMQTKMVGKTFGNAIIAFAVLFSASTWATKLSIVTEHLAPFQIVDAHSVTGLSTEIVVATLEASGYEYNIDVHPWSLAFKLASQEKNTCIYSLARIPVREPLFHWIGPIVSSSISFYALRNKDITITNIEDAKQYKTAVIKDDVTHHFLLSKGFVENKNLYVMSNYDALLTLLEVTSRNIDLVIVNDDLIFHRVKGSTDLLKYHNVLPLDELRLDFHLACGFGTQQDIVNNLTMTMKNLEQLGTFTKIIEKWRPKMINML